MLPKSSEIEHKVKRTLSSWVLVAAVASLTASSSVFAQTLWQNSFEREEWEKDWGVVGSIFFGRKNIQRVVGESEVGSAWARVHYPAGSWAPLQSAKQPSGVGGAGFVAAPLRLSADSLHFRYYVRFPEGFDFVKGGKLPGLYGGNFPTGGFIPNGRDGFTTRFMWIDGNLGEIYAYLPESKVYGTSIGKGRWSFERGRWHVIEQQVVLNTPGQRDGRLRVWFDERLVVDEMALRFRDVADLKIDGIIFSTFFGGGDPTWSTPKDTYVEFAKFALGRTYIGR
jgi:hypothetical protein